MQTAAMCEPVQPLKLRCVLFAMAICFASNGPSSGQELVFPREAGPAPALPAVPSPLPGDQPLPINLPTAMQLAGAKPLDIAIASQRLQTAAAELQRADVLWLPTLLVGADYLRHDGRIQDVGGRMLDDSKSTLMVGAGPTMVFAMTDAIYAPLAARQTVAVREGDLQTARNDSLLAVALAYFSVQQARGEFAGAMDSTRSAEELVQRVEKLIEALVPAVEKNRALTELARRRQAAELAYERWQTSSAELARILRLHPSALVQPLEPPDIQIDLFDVQRPVDEFIPQALTSRPELASQQAAVQATLARLKQERMRPLVPSVLIRGAATNPAGTLAGGYFGGGRNDDLSDFGGRNSIDFQLLWEFQNLGFGNQALVRQRTAESDAATLALFRTQDLVAAEVVQAHAQAQRAAQRVRLAIDEVRNAQITVRANLAGVEQTRAIGNTLVLVYRPLDVVVAVQMLDQAYRDYYGAIADENRAQFRLYRAMGQPAMKLIEDQAAGALPPCPPGDPVPRRLPPPL